MKLPIQRLSLVILITWMTGILFCQTPDSIQWEGLMSVALDTSRIDSQLVLAKQMASSNPQLVRKWLERTQSQAEEIAYWSGKSQAIKQLIQLLETHTTESDLVLKWNDAFVENLSNLNDSLEIGRGFSFAGNIYVDHVALDKGFTYLKQALDIFHRNQQHRDAVIVLNLMARLTVTHDVESATEYLERAYAIAVEQKFTRFAAILSINISIYGDSLDTKLIWIDRARDLAVQLNDTSILAGVLVSKAEILRQQDKPLEAISAYRNGIQYYQSKNADDYVAINSNLLSDLYLQQNKPDSALYFSKIAHGQFKNDPQSYPYYSTLHSMSLALGGLKQYELAFDTLSKAFDLAAEYYRKNLDEQLQELNKQYETAEKEKQIAEQALQLSKEKNKRTRQFILGGVILLCLLSAFIFYYLLLRRRRRKIKHQLELKEVESRAMRDLHDMKARWFENISHDLRTPLTLIAAPLEDLSRSVRSKQDQKLLDLARSSTNHLRQLTTEMLELSRLENTEIPIRTTIRNLHGEFEKMMSAFDSFASEHNIELIPNNTIDKNLWVNVDYDKLEKVFNNLVKNAIQYSGEGSQVRMTSNYMDSSIELIIEDGGVGIPKNEIPFLFDKYYRANDQQSNRIEGSGLGLAIVKELVDRLQGEIKVESELNKGTKFHVLAPATIEDPVQTNQTEIGAETEAESKTSQIDGVQRILIVEDNRNMRDYLELTLGIDFDIESCENPQMALQVMANQSFDLVLSDVMMPVMDGFQFKKRVNALANSSNIPFIFITAKALVSDKLEGLRLGVDDYITKPFSTEELKVRIKNVLTRRQTRLISNQEEDNDEVASEEFNENNIIRQASEIIHQHLDDINFGVDQLADQLNYSTRQLNRNIKKVTGLTTVQFILELRLQEARRLFMSGEVYSVKEAQFRIGLHSQSYFSKKYSERFGHNPGLHVKE